MRRRDFIRASAAGSALAFLPGFGFVGCVSHAISTDGRAIDPRFCSPVDKPQFEGGFYIEFINGRDGYRPNGLNLADWNLRLIQTVGGSVVRETELSFDAIAAAHPAEEVSFFNTFQCVGNVPGGVLASNGYFTGLPLRHFLTAELGVDLASARRVRFRCFDGYSSNHRIERVMVDEPSPLYLAYAFDGIRFDAQTDGALAHGYPVRIVCQDMMGMKSPKALMEIEVTDSDDVFGYWESRPISPLHPDITWADLPILKINSRIFDPIDYQPVARTFVVKGTAWSGASPLRRVEVGIQPDGSGEQDIVWRDATITPPSAIVATDRPDYDTGGSSAFADAVARVIGSDEPVPFVWSLWEAQLSLPTSAKFHRVYARAVDADGTKQPLQLALTETAGGSNAVQSVAVQLTDADQG